GDGQPAVRPDGCGLSGGWRTGPCRVGVRGRGRADEATLRHARRLVQLVAPEDPPAQPHDRVVPPVHDAFLHRDDAVIGDLDVLRAHLGAALRDVAVPDALFPDRLLLAVGTGVERVHVELGRPDEEPRAGEGRLVVLVVADDMAHVLAEEALDALAELLRALHVHLLHAVLARSHPGRWRER